MKTSIIILTYNKLHLTKDCLNSIFEHTDLNQIEIIIVDNGSTDGTKEFLNQISGIKTIFNDKNLGFSKGCNQGVHLASGDAILFLNNDTVVTKNWLTNMFNLLYSDEKIGMVGPVTNYASGPQQIATSYSKQDGLDDFANKHIAKNSGLSKQVLRLVGFCLLTKRSVLDQIGLFDEQFKIGSFEDDDLCFRAVQHGYYLKIAHDSFVHHEGHATFTGNQNLNISQSYIENKERFITKWNINPLDLFYRSEIIQLIPENAKNILDVGCGAGATGLEIMNRQDCRIYGIEKNSTLSKIADRNYASIYTENIETFIPEYTANFFDVIIYANVLEYLQDPWGVVRKLSIFLKPEGHIICCIPNVTHAEVLIQLLQGGWKYTDKGILSQSHLRFFTQSSALTLFPNDLFLINNIYSVKTQITDELNQILSKLTEIGKEFNLHTDSLIQQARTYHILIRATKK